MNIPNGVQLRLHNWAASGQKQNGSSRAFGVVIQIMMVIAQSGQNQIANWLASLKLSHGHRQGSQNAEQTE